MSVDKFARAGVPEAGFKPAAAAPDSPLAAEAAAALAAPTWSPPPKQPPGQSPDSHEGAAAAQRSLLESAPGFVPASAQQESKLPTDSAVSLAKLAAIQGKGGVEQPGLTSKPLPPSPPSGSSFAEYAAEQRRILAIPTPSLPELEAPLADEFVESRSRTAPGGSGAQVPNAGAGKVPVLPAGGAGAMESLTKGAGVGGLQAAALAPQATSPPATALGTGLLPGSKVSATAPVGTGVAQGGASVGVPNTPLSKSIPGSRVQISGTRRESKAPPVQWAESKALVGTAD